MAAAIAKICGITSKDALEACIKFGARYVGFVHYEKSPRHINPMAAAKLAYALPNNIKSVAVIVDKSAQEIDTYLTAFTPDFLQLHGSETVEFVQSLRKRLPSKIGIIKALSVKSGDDIALAHTYASHVDMLLFDAKAPASGLPGGNGLRFDWALLKNRSFDISWFLSGGLTADNVEEAVRVSGTKLVDVSSGVESAPGVKDLNRIEEFLTRLHGIHL
jgi:phosphoribosylanthranilate isomerase